MEPSERGAGNLQAQFRCHKFSAIVLRFRSFPVCRLFSFVRCVCQFHNATIVQASTSLLLLSCCIEDRCYDPVSAVCKANTTRTWFFNAPIFPFQFNSKDSYSHAFNQLTLHPVAFALLDHFRLPVPSN